MLSIYSSYSRPYPKVPDATQHDGQPVFDNAIANATLHVPAASIEAYRNAESWKDFKEIVALTDSDPNPTGITNISNESKMSAYVSVAEGGKSAVVYLNQVVSGVPAEATIDASRTRLNAQEAILQVKNKKEFKTKLILTKKDSVDQSKLLKGVIFEIFTDAACTTKASNTKDAEGTQKDSFITNEAGLLIIDNLEANKTYYLREKMAASGHYLLTGAIPIAFDADGLLSIGTIADTELRSHVWLDTDTTEETNDMIVTNSPYYDLPSAGGPGSYIFTIIGVAICAITVLMKYRERTETGRA